MPQARLKSLLRISTTVLLVLAGAWLYFTQPTFRSSETVPLSVDQARLLKTVQTLSVDFFPRNFRNPENLDRTARFIEENFKKAGGRVAIQEFSVSGTNYRNIRCFFGPHDAPRFIVGAHYDSAADTPGADDNASGVAGLIELAYLCGNNPPGTAIELVAYTLEEPPFFATTKMGSYFHAKAVADEGKPILGVIALEMIGYYSDKFGSQDYPALLFKFLYPNTGDFIAVIGKRNQRAFISQVKVRMKGASDLEVYSISAPPQIPGIDFSDHRNYWEFGYDAVMITDTAFFRNHEYHKPGDTWDRLNYEKMGAVVKAVYSVLRTPSEL